MLRLTNARVGVRALAVALAAALTTLGCTPLATFPPTTGRPVVDPSTPPLPDLMVVALQAGHQQSSMKDGELIFNLPPGVLPVTWKRIDERLGDGARAARPDDARYLTIEQIRLDGARAEVDMVVPEEMFFRFYTLHLSGAPFEAWKVTYVQPWTIRQAPPPVNNPNVTVRIEPASAPVPSGS